MGWRCCFECGGEGEDWGVRSMLGGGGGGGEIVDFVSGIVYLSHYVVGIIVHPKTIVSLQAPTYIPQSSESTRITAPMQYRSQLYRGSD